MKKPPTDRRPRALSLLAAALVATSCGGSPAPVPPERDITPLESRFDPELQPFAFLLPHMPPPQSLAGIRAADCGKCHGAIYREWKQSTHAHALEDLQFQAELAKPDSPKWLCLNCHIPLADQRESVAIGLVDDDLFRPALEPNPRFDAGLRDEAITCAVCHLRLDKRGRTTVLGVHESSEAPHPVLPRPDELRSVCLRCHDPKGEALTPNLVCWFTTVEESGDAGHAPTDCSSCHMPRVRRPLAENRADLPERDVPRHGFPGGGIPKTFDGFEERAANGWRSGLEIETRREGDDLIVVLTNAHAGHAIPTADPERFLHVRLRGFDAAGNVIFEATERIGQRWEWSPARKLGDNRIAPGESRELSFTTPSAADRLVLDVLAVRLSRASAAAMIASTGLDETLLPGANELVRQLPSIYPTAAYIARVTWIGPSAPGVPADEAELVRLSIAEREIPLDERGY
ncbi:MAG TPA: cytochrome C554 and C-prime [Planctomycetes bacterium]|nr:cytochrome C554 and C-prime [Planctomycetota bacterium]